MHLGKNRVKCLYKYIDDISSERTAFSVISLSAFFYIYFSFFRKEPRIRRVIRVKIGLRKEKSRLLPETAAFREKGKGEKQYEQQ